MQAEQPWIDRHLNTVVFAVVMCIGWTANYAILHANVLENERRIQLLESEVVPRQEHMMRDEQLNKRLDTLTTQVSGVQASINDLLREQYAAQGRR